MTDDLEQPAPRVFGDLDRAILEFERLTWRFQGAKESEILRRRRGHRVLAIVLAVHASP